MITTRTRFLSILATVAMLVSMLACFIIPASADALSDYTEVLADIASGATNLEAEVAKGAEATADTLKAAAQADATAGTIVWKEFHYKNEPFPGYALREAYEAAGYASYEANRTQWSIGSAADWRKMIADSTYDADGGTLFNGSQDLLFTGSVFHLYQDVDFNNEDMAPLCFGQTGGDNEKKGTFNGTINGHGFAFKNINVVATSTEGGKNFSSGMIGKLGYQATITAFGVDSGSVTGTSAANATKSIYMSLFGDPYIPASGTTATTSLTRVWCGATITAIKGEGATGDAYAAGFLALARNAGVTLNGGYFYGTLNGAKSTAAMIIDNRNEKIYNSLSDTTATSMLAISNTQGACNYNRSVGSPVFGGTTLPGDNATATSAAIGAYEINKLNNEAAAADGLDKIYYTWREDSLGNTVIRPLGNENNQIVKLTVNGKDEYVNKGTELTKADLAAKAEIAEEDIVVILVNEEDKSGETTFTVSGDTEITVAAAQIDWASMLGAEVAKYSALESKYYSVDSVAAVAAFLDAAAAAQDEAAIKAALEMAEALEESITTYATYPEEEGKEIPAFTMRDTFGAYNKNNVWAVKTTADWLAMVEASKVGDGKEANDFEGYTFHLFNDIDFADVEDPMDPLNYGTGAGNDTSCVFNGTIEGHGYALKNIKVYVSCTSSSTNYVVGLIGKVGKKAIINNFGVDSGTISADGSAKALYVATFGEPQAGTDSTSQLNNVWSGATITANATTASENANNFACGIFASGQDSTVTINGAYFYGTVNAPNAFGIYDYVKNAPKIYNALSNATFAGTPTEFGMQRRSTTESHTYTIINNFSVGAPIHNQASFLEADATAGKIVNSATVGSALEGAYEINKANLAAPAVEGAAKVYFTKVGNAIRFGAENNRIVKVTVGGVDKTIYININQEYTKAELADLLNIKVENITEITAGENATYENDVLVVTGDAAITVAATSCDHSANTNETYTKVDGADKHVLLCSVCGEATADAVDCAGTIVADSNIDENGVSKHTMKCDVCGTDYEYECTAEKYINVDDCTVAHEWRFACGVHEAAYTIDGTAKADHDFSASEWNNDEGVEGKQYKLCANCSTKIYQYVGAVSATKIELAPVETGDIVITLPAYLATADLKFTITGDYTIVNVVGATQDGEIYKVNGETTVTVTIASTVASNGGSFKVELTNAKATDGNDITDGNAMADITFKPCDHSRNENTTYTKVDGEDKHVLLCSICGVATAEAEDCAGTIVADSNIDENGVSKHTMKCDKCGTDYEYECTATKFFDPADCTVAHEWRFDCGVHEAAYVIDGSAKADHDYSGEWVDVEGVPTKQSKTCANCTTTIYQYVGAISATDIELAPNTASNIVVTLPEYLATADLRFSITGDYTITNVEGAIADGEIYKANAATVTVTISAAETATGGSFMVDMLNAKATDDIVITDASATAAIAHKVVVCPHTNKEYVKVDGEDKHVLTCTDCNEAIAPAEDCAGTIVADSNIDADGNSKHTMKCDKCGTDYEYDCKAEKYINADDCTEDHKWMFACGVHAAEYVIADSGKDAHDFDGSEWAAVEGDATKQYRQCAYCSTKEYRYIGEVAAAGISVKPNAEGDIVITLPANVATADLTFTITGGYTIKSIEGAIADGDVYKATAATVTVSLNAASATAIGGTFKVEMTNAKATDDLAITDAAAEAEIVLDGVKGDANGDNKLNLSDALNALYVVAGKADAKPINTANADMNNDGNILVDDVYAIVSAWLKTRLADM